MTTNTPLTLITGGTGKTGRRIVTRFEHAGLPVRVGSRTGQPAFDWDDPATWPHALQGVEVVYLSYFPDLAVPGAAQTVGDFARLAAKCGAQRIVLLSGRGEPEAALAEQAVQSAGIAWTVVRCSWFSQNFSESFLLGPVLAGEVALPVDGVGEPFVDVEDVADVAFAALTQEGYAGMAYELTGPLLLSFDEAVALIAEACGRQIRFVPVTPQELVSALDAHGVPDDEISLITYLFTEVLDGRNAHISDGVQRALGRPPRGFADYARETAAAGLWTT